MSFISSWLGTGKPRRAEGRITVSAPGFRPRLEALELRAMPDATIVTRQPDFTSQTDLLDVPGDAAVQVLGASGNGRFLLLQSKATNLARIVDASGVVRPQVSAPGQTNLFWLERRDDGTNNIVLISAYDPAPALAVLRDLPTADVAPAIAALNAVRTVVTSGRRLQGVAEAAALGLCELSQSPAISLEGGQLRHGPMEIMSPDLGVVLFASDEPDAGLVMGMARSASDAGAAVVVFDASGAAPLLGVTTISMPKSSGMAAILTVLPAIQRFMLGYAVARVADVGTPRRSSKITRTE